MSAWCSPGASPTTTRRVSSDNRDFRADGDRHPDGVRAPGGAGEALGRHLRRLGGSARRHPRVSPIAFHFDGSRFVLGTIDFSAKVRAIQANPAVALTVDTDDQPPLVLMVRGTAEVSFVDGVLPEYLEANRKMFSAAAFPAFEAEVRRLYDRMARIDITPT